MKTLDFTFYLAPGVPAFEGGAYASALRDVRRNLGEHFDISMNVSFEKLPEGMYRQYMAGAKDLRSIDRLQGVSAMLTKLVGHPDGISCVITDVELGPYVGGAVPHTPLMLVSPHLQDLGQTILHELGHCCGIEGHVNDPESIMFPFGDLTSPSASWDAESKSIVAKGLARYARY